MSTTGIERVLRNYDTHVEDVAGKKTYVAVHRILSIGAENASVMVPVDTANLVDSQYAPIIERSEGKTTGYVGFTAEYAFWVHEMSGKLKGQPRADFGVTRAGTSFGGGTGRGYYWEPQGEPKFLEKGFEQGMDDFKRILEDEYRV